MPHLGGHLDLAGVRAGKLVGRGERHIRPEERLDALGRGDGRGPGQAVGVREQQRPLRAHQLGPVEEREALLCLQRDGLDPRLAQGKQGRHHLPTQLDLAAPDQRQRQVGERRQVARGAHAPLRRHDRMDARREEGEEPIHQEGPATGVAQRERVGPQEQHRPDDVPGERRADADGVAHEQVLLELPRIGRRDVRARQVPETGGDPVDDVPGRDEPLHDGPGLLHPDASVDVQAHRHAPAGDRFHVGDGEVRARQDHRVGVDEDPALGAGLPGGREPARSVLGGRTAASWPRA